jgi:hypothetical protein
MDKYENHKDKRYKELNERMQKLGNKKNLTKGRGKIRKLQ